jgi:MFS transporter, DHA1 family, inner membrane transport protein
LCRLVLAPQGPERPLIGYNTASERVSTNSFTEPSAASSVQPRFDPRVWLLALGTFAVGTDSFVISGILNQLAHDLAIDLDTAGNVVSSYSLAYGLSAPFLAALTGRFRKDRVVLTAIALFAVANALCAVAPTYSTIIVARILTGLAAGLYTPTAYALAAMVAPPERKASALAAVALGITVSFVAGVPLGIVVGRQFGWHASFWLIAGFSLIAFAAIGLYPPRGLTTTISKLDLAARFAPLVHARTLLALLPTLLFTAGTISTYTYMGALLQAHELPADTVVFYYFIFGMGGLIGTQVGGRVIDRFGPVPLLVLFLLIGILNTGLYHASLAIPATLTVTTFMLHFVLWALIIGQQRRLIKLSPEHNDVVLALNNSCIYVGIAVGASIGGLIIAQGFGLDRIPVASSALFVVAMLVFGATYAVERDLRGESASHEV